MDPVMVAPMLSYEDVGAAADWLCSAFGFEESERFEDGGRVTHVTLQAGEGVVMAGWPGPHYRSPKRHAESCEDARRWLETPFVVDGVYVWIADIQAHFEHVRSVGTHLLSDLESNEGLGQRLYRAEDIEGHRWMFAGPL